MTTGLVVASSLLLVGCEDFEMPAFLAAKPEVTADGNPIVDETGVRATERDVEAPEIFEAREDGLWDGRPSLGGVWAAHPDVKDPERVLIRNETNGQFVIGALFRKERETPGPRLQISSDAAAALGMLAGAPTDVSVVALRREEVAAETPPPPPPTEAPPAGALDAPSTIDTATLDPVAEAAANALDDPAPAAAPPAPAPVAAAPAPRPASTLAKPFVQLGIFSVQQNAENTATAMRQRGLIPTIKKQSTRGKTFWRVLVGPATNKSELDILLKTSKDAGFGDAYSVSN